MGKSDGKKYTMVLRPYYDEGIEPVPCTTENFFNMLWDELCHLTGTVFSIFTEGMSDYYKEKEKERNNQKNK